MPGLKEIAKMTGMSVSTVSRVLRDPEYHCKDRAMRDRIWDAAMELGYSPNEAARALKSGIPAASDKDVAVGNTRTMKISIIMTRTDEAQTDPFFSEVLRVAETELNRNLCIVNRVWYQTVLSDDRLCRRENLSRLVKDMWKKSGECDNGLIVIGRCNHEALVELRKTYRNVVSVNRNPVSGETDEVTCDGRLIATKAVEYLIKQGFRDIGYVGSCSGETRYEGYLSTLSSHGLDVNPASIHACRASESEGFRIMEEMLEEKELPDAVFCANDIIAVGMIKCMRLMRRRKLPFAIIASDDISLAQEVSPMLTTIALPSREMGKFAVSLLLDRIVGGHDSVVSMKLSTSLVRRESA